MDFFRYLHRSKLLSIIRKLYLINFLLGAVDVIAITLAFQYSYLSISSNSGLFFAEKNFLILFFCILPFWLLTLYLLKDTEIPRNKRYRVLFLEYVLSAVIMLAFLFILFIILKLDEFTILFMVELVFFGFLFLFSVRILEYKVFKIYRAKGYNQKNIVLIADDSSQSFIEDLRSKPEWGFRIIAIFSSSSELYKKYAKSVIFINDEDLPVLDDLIKADIVDEVLYLKQKEVSSEVRKAIRSCEELGIVFRLKFDDKTINLTNAFKTKIADVTFLNFINTPNNQYRLALKKIMDIHISLFMLLILSPLLLVVSALIKYTSHGPVIYKQSRVGLRGRKFNLYKFRTMVSNADELRKDLDSKNEVDGPVFKIKNDPRITKIGKVLRKTGMDELPQLLNILKGDMSLIGPRPPLESETNQYKRGQLRRLSVKPGLSCFWQIKPDRNNIKFEKWVDLDLAYIDNWSLRLDILILFKTIKTVFQRSGL